MISSTEMLYHGQLVESVDISREFLHCVRIKMTQVM